MAHESILMAVAVLLAKGYASISSDGMWLCCTCMAMQTPVTALWQHVSPSAGGCIVGRDQQQHTVLATQPRGHRGIFAKTHGQNLVPGKTWAGAQLYCTQLRYRGYHRQGCTWMVRPSSSGRGRDRSWKDSKLWQVARQLPQVRLLCSWPSNRSLTTLLCCALAAHQACCACRMCPGLDNPKCS